uniref:protocadherin 18-like n=1 Tax=Myxine glutinosa TaxID=7769 RepID=UPI00358F6BE0
MRPLAFLLLWFTSARAFTVHYSIPEEQRPGTFVGRLSDALRSRLPETSPGRFRLMRSDALSLLHLREEDGTISTRDIIDREGLCGLSPTCFIRFDVLCLLPGDAFRLVHVDVEVMDVNDHSPRFARPVQHVELAESAAVGARVPLEAAHDRDVGGNGLRLYALPENDYFGLAMRTAVDGSKHAELVLEKELDRESIASYDLVLTAWDGGQPPLSCSTLLRVTVLDANDNVPMFSRTTYTVSVREDAAPGTTLLSMEARDADDGPNGEVVYSFGSSVDVEVKHLFYLDPSSGMLSLMGNLDYEARSEYEIAVRARDMGPSSIPTHCKVLVQVEDVNDNAPEIKLDIIMHAEQDTVYVSEGAVYESFIGLVVVLDKDSDSNGRTRCQLRGHPHFKLQPYRNDYVIVTNATLDRESVAEYSLTLEAEDRGIPVHVVTRTFMVKIVDENDNAPRFQQMLYEASLIENNPAGAYITSVTARDVDSDNNGMIAYNVVEKFLEGTALSSYVSIDPASGALYALRPMDFERLGRLEFQVQARDNGNPPLVSNATVILQVVDENDNLPVITHPPMYNGTAQVLVSPYAGPGYLVTVLRATDRDSSMNGNLVYSAQHGSENKLFHVDSTTGEIFTSAIFRLEEVARRQLLSLVVCDRGTPPLSATALLEILLAEAAESSSDGGAPRDAFSQMDNSRMAVVALGAACVLALLAVIAVLSTRSHNLRKVCGVSRPPSRDCENIPCDSQEAFPAANPSTGDSEMSYSKGTIDKSDIVMVVTDEITKGKTSSQKQGLDPRLLSAPPGAGTPQLECCETSAPPAEVSQILTILRQGNYRPRPSFRGNKNCGRIRCVPCEGDGHSLKDSGRGDSESEEMDSEAGRSSPASSISLSLIMPETPNAA